ncbi:hypothetical protein R3P38DRAFT_3183909 [Favolaschia claudopus]|uniref:Uncharacterized protein n=1 Tax=Favolaschia claudopus TaxID=2862362 RepID=A0AAW0CBZ0_9AGAR
MNDATVQLFSTQTNRIRFLNEPPSTDGVQMTISKFAVADPEDSKEGAGPRKTAQEYENA